MGMAGLKDHQLMDEIREKDYTFVTNNAVDFRSLFEEKELHPGLIIIVPNVVPDIQRRLFSAALDALGTDEPINTVIEVDWDGANIIFDKYDLPEA